MAESNAAIGVEVCNDEGGRSREALSLCCLQQQQPFVFGVKRELERTMY